MAELVPEVVVLPAGSDPSEYARLVLADPRFERMTLTDEDRRRTDAYRQESAREELRAASLDLSSFLAGLDTRVRIGEASVDDVARVAELTRKTNQFNVTTRRYSEQQVDAMVARSELARLRGASRRPLR